METEKKRAGKDYSRSDAPMKFSDGSKLLHGAIMVMRIMGWAWRWAEWWVQHGSTWEPLLEAGQKESEMTAKELRIVENSKESRMHDARRCRLSAFGAALRNRSYDTKDGFNTKGLERALRAVLHTQSLVGPLEEHEIDFFADLLARAYRSKSRLLGFGEDKIPVATEAFCLHIDDKSPKFELGNRSLPGNDALSHDEIFEEPVSEPDDYLKYKKSENGNEIDIRLFTEIDYKYRGTLKDDTCGENSDDGSPALIADINTNLFDKENSYILKQRRGRIPKVMRLAIVVKIAGDELLGRSKRSRRPTQSATNDDSDAQDESIKSRKKEKRRSRDDRQDTNNTYSYKSAEARMKFDTEGFRPLSSSKVEFLLHVGIKSVDEFMKTATKDISDQYTIWRDHNGINPLKDSSAASNSISKWKSDVRKYYSQFIEANGSASKETVLSDSETEPHSTRDQPDNRLRSRGSRNSVEKKKSTASIESENSSLGNAGLECPRPLKKSRTQLDNASTSIRSKHQDDKGSANVHKLEDKTSNKRSRLSAERRKIISSVEASDDATNISSPGSRPRRSNVYKKGSLKEVDDDSNEIDSEKDILESVESTPIKRKRGRPRKATRTLESDREVDDDFNTNNSRKDVLNSAEPKQIERKRSRPRRATPTPKIEEDVESESDSDATVDTTSTTLTKAQHRKTRGNPHSIDLLHVLPDEGKEFLRIVGITSDRSFLTANTGQLAMTMLTLPAFCKKKGHVPLKKPGATSKLSHWKRAVRDAATKAGDIELADVGYYVSNQFTARRKAEVKKNVETDDDDKCVICDDGGDLIVCDGCDKTHHTVCVGLNKVPEGDWFCPECGNKDDDKCVICNDGGDLIVCDGCEKTYHTGCVDLKDVPEGDWFCSECDDKDDDKCAICDDGGVLIVCDGCEESYHTDCLSLKKVPEGDYFCPRCIP